MKGFPSREQVERLRQQYPKGTKICCDYMSDDPRPIPPGRNIYQAACGNCNECTSFISNLKTEKGIPVEAKEHILNGMVFELY